MAAVEAELAVMVPSAIGATLPRRMQQQQQPMERLTWGGLDERSLLLISSDDRSWPQPQCQPWSFDVCDVCPLMKGSEKGGKLVTSIREVEYPFPMGKAPVEWKLWKMEILIFRFPLECKPSIFQRSPKQR